VKTYGELRTTPGTWRPSLFAVPLLPQDYLVLVLVALSYLLRLLHRFLFVSCRLNKGKVVQCLCSVRKMKNLQRDIIACLL